MRQVLRMKISKEGVLVPRDLLTGFDEVEIRREAGRVVLSPAEEEDPILGLGTQPVACEAADASENLDAYLYSPPR